MSTLIGIAGTGLGMAIPDQRWIGWAIVALAIVIFAVQVRYENGHIKIGWGAPERARMWPIIGMTLSAIAFIGFGVWYTLASEEGVNFKILKVTFDPNGPTEFYVDFNIANLGKPTTLEDWSLSIRRAGHILWEREPRVTFMSTYNPSANKLDPPLDLAKRPLASGEQLRPHFTWTYDGNAKEVFGYPGTLFVLSARDIRGREVSDTYELR